MELSGLERPVGEAVLGRRWEVKVGLVRGEGCQCQYKVGSLCPGERGRSKAWHGQFLPGRARMAPLPVQGPWHGWPRLKKKKF